MKVDLGMILDVTGSTVKFKRVFIAQLVSELGLSEDTVRASVIASGPEAKLPIKFNSHKDTAAFSKAVDSISWMKGTRDLGKALKLAQKDMFVEENGSRKNAAKVLVVTVDAEYMKAIKESGEINRLRGIATELADMDVEVIMIGIGDVAIEDVALLTARSDGKSIQSNENLECKSFVQVISRIIFRIGGYTYTLSVSL